MKKTHLLLYCFLLLPLLSLAHGSHGSGFMAGFTHPLLGLDHNLALLGTGVLSYIVDKKRWYIYASAFIIMMAVGGAMGIGNEASELIESLIATSVIVIGLMIAFGWRQNCSLILLTLAVFGYLHGYAHGAEKPADTTAFIYIAGFLTGAMILSALGWIISWYANKRGNPYRVFRFIGSIFVGFGLIQLIY